MNSHITLEFDKILEQLCDLAVSDNAKRKLSELRPYLNESECRRKMQETTEAKAILARLGTPSLAAMKDIGKLLELSGKGSMLTAEQLTHMAQFLFTCKRMKIYLKKAEDTGGSVAFFGGSLDPVDSLYEEINRDIRNEAVEDSASPALRDIRRRLENGGAQIKAKLESLLRGKKEWFTDGFIATRNGRFVLPVKKEFRKQVSGSVIDTSSSGGTIFIEPASVRKLEEELLLLRIDEENEIRRILYTLTALVDGQSGAIKMNIEVMETLDFVFAKAKLSEKMNAISVAVAADRKIVIKAGRHPLLNQSDCVPLDFEIGGDYNGVVITGPNTGGKTVALKTVGLLSLMAQSGLHVPVESGSTFCMHNLILCDMGDGQSIAENLSTFSSHIVNIIDILNSVTNESLVLLDELGSGTDPAEGMGIAVAVLDELKRRGCLFAVSTHYPEIKEYAQKTPGLINARMAFDRESLRPLYRLEMGEAGESCALFIAKRLGFPEHLLKIAGEMAYHGASSEPGGATITEVAPLTEPVAQKNSSPKIEKEKIKPAEENRRRDSFHIGDCVLVYPQKEIGIVFKPANERGEIGVQTKKEKRLISYKRIKLHVPADKLYPPDYDFSIIFDTVANRKARRTMQKRHDPNAVIEIEKGNQLL